MKYLSLLLLLTFPGHHSLRAQTVEELPVTVVTSQSPSPPAASAPTARPVSASPRPAPPTPVEVEPLILHDEAPVSSSATRTGTPLSEIPQSIQVVTEDQLDAQLVDTLTEAVRNVPGVGGKSKREFQQSAVNGDYLVRGLYGFSYLNGRQNYINSGFAPINFVNVEQVEVLKGPGSALFSGGVGAPIGGIINLVEKQPLDESFLTLGGRVGSYEERAAYMDWNEVLNENWSARLTAEWGSTEFEIDGLRQEGFSIHPTLLADYGDTRILFRARYQELDYDNYLGLDTSDAILDANGVVIGTLIPPETNKAAADMPRSSFQSFGFESEIEHDLTDSLMLRLRSGYRETEDENHASIFFGPTRYDATLEQDISIFDLGVDLVARQESENFKNTLLVGFDYTETDATFTTLESGITVPATAPYTVAPVGRQNGVYETASIVLQDQLTYADRVHLLGGATVTDFSLDYGGDYFGFPRARELNQTETSYKGGIVVDLNDAFSLFGGYSVGYKLPSPIIAASPRFIGVPELERSEQAEVGVRFRTEDNRVAGSLALFDVDVENGAESTFFTPFQVGQSSQGFEADLNIAVTESTSLTLIYAYTDAQINDATSPLDGNDLLRVPEHSGRVYLRQAINAFPGWGIGFGMTAMSERPGNLANTFSLESHAVFDAQIDYVNEHFTFRLGAENLFNENYFVPNLIQDGNIGLADPLRVSSSIEYRF